jgi:hypothetical protein
MTTGPVPALIPSSPRSVDGLPAHARRPRLAPGAGRPLTLPRLAPTRSTSATYAFAAADINGRLCAPGVFDALGWKPGACLGLREAQGLLVVDSDHSGKLTINSRGHLRLSAAARRWCGVTAGSRVLLVAEPAMDRLVIHPLATLDQMITWMHERVLGGEAK